MRAIRTTALEASSRGVYRTKNTEKPSELAITRCIFEPCMNTTLQLMLGGYFSSLNVQISSSNGLLSNCLIQNDTYHNRV